MQVSANYHGLRPPCEKALRLSLTLRAWSPLRAIILSDKDTLLQFRAEEVGGPLLLQDITQPQRAKTPATHTMTLLLPCLRSWCLVDPISGLYKPRLPLALPVFLCHKREEKKEPTATIRQITDIGFPTNLGRWRSLQWSWIKLRNLKKHDITSTLNIEKFELLISHLPELNWN